METTMNRLAICLLAVSGCGGATSALDSDAEGVGGAQQVVTTAVTTVVATTVYIERSSTGGRYEATTGSVVATGGAVATKASTTVAGATKATGGSSSTSNPPGGDSAAGGTVGAGGSSGSVSSVAAGGTLGTFSVAVADCDKYNQDNDQLCWYKPNTEDPSKCMSVMNLGGGNAKYTNDIRMACAADGNRMCNQGTESGYLNNRELFSASDCFTLCVVCYREKKSDRLSDDCLAMRAQYDDELACLSPVGY